MVARPHHSTIAAFTNFFKGRDKCFKKTTITYFNLKRYSQSTALGITLLTGASLAAPALAASPCTGPGAPTTTETKCLTAVQIPGNALRSFDISWVNPNRAEYYLGDRSNKGIDVVSTATNTWTRRLIGFVGIVTNPMTGAVNTAKSGPDGVTSHGGWVYGGDGDSTLKVFNLNSARYLYNAGSDNLDRRHDPRR